MSTFNPTPSELALTSQVFTLADPQNVGILTGDTAVKILSGANLSHVVLGEIWAIADKDNNGFLTKKGVTIALRLIGYAQKGETISGTLLDRPGPLAYIDGISQPSAAGSSTPSSPVPQSPSAPSSTLPPLTQQDKTKFLKLFIGCGPINGLLSGEKSRDVFVKSKLPYEKLSHIWTLADTKTRGALDSTDFTIGMYLIQASMSTPSLLLPVTLPSWLYDQAVQSLDATATVNTHVTGGSASGLNSPLQSSFQSHRQYTDSGTVTMGATVVKPQHNGQPLPQTPTRQPTSGFTRSSTSPPAAGSINSTKPFSQTWGISPGAKTSSDKFFDGLDSQHRGYIEGDVAVPFMLESKLPGGELAQIWDLADLHNDGRLTREGFAVAMHIINSRLAGNELPSTLPPSLVPPSMRSPQPSTITAQNEPQLDLLLDDTPPSTALQAEPAGGSGQTQTPASAFGQNLGKDAFPASFQGVYPPSLEPQQPFSSRPATNEDLLGDDDETSRPGALPDNSAEIGNLRNQVSSTTRSLNNTRAERASTEQAVSQQMTELSLLQTQLSSARSSYETESQLLASLRERLVTQRIDIQKTREELISAESDLSATKVEKAEVEGSVLRDKEEIRDLQRRMKEVGAETDVLKAAIEKAKKDVRQQKGLLAIAKKQLATAEADKLKTTTALEDAKRELEGAQHEKKAMDERLSEFEVAPPSIPDDFIHVDRVVSPAPSTSATTIPLPDTPQSTTPQPSAIRQITNPFERLAMAAVGSADSTPAFQNLSTLDNNSPPVEPSDPFILASNPAVTGLPPAPTVMVDAAVKSEPSMAAGSGSDMTLQVSAISPAEDEALFLTPHDDQHDVGKVPSDQHTLPGAYPSVVEGNDVIGPLHEIEHDGSETSDSDDDQPLGAKLAAENINEQIPSDGTPQVTRSNIPELESSTSIKPAFDDTFGAMGYSINSPTGKTSPTTSGKSSPRRNRSPGRTLSTRTLSSHSVGGGTDPFGTSNLSHTPLEPPEERPAPPPTIETVLEPNASPAILNPSSINDFDEALGKLPSSTKDASLAFKLDSAFDDNFDFSSASNGITSELPDANSRPESKLVTSTTSFPPVSAPLTPSIPVEDKSQAKNPILVTESVMPFSSPVTTTSPADATASVSFDDAFGLNSPNSNGQQSTANGSVQPFEGFGSLSTQVSSLSATGNPFPMAQPSRPTLAESLSSLPPTPLASPPIQSTSPRQSRVSSGISKAASSPPRASSPRLRATSGSKAFSSESKPEASSKHKLSIRFPFGRKDKSRDKEDKRVHSQAHQQLPDPQQFLTPISEPPLPGTVTPAVDDDAEPVKQLAAMGFSRTQSIAALETHGYDVQKALNSLLGAA